MESPVTTTTGCPVRAPMSASPIPVFPDVLSTMVPPGCRSPLRSAARTMLSAVRSLMEPPGFSDSSFAKTVPGRPLLSVSRGTSGVEPTRASTASASASMSTAGAACRGSPSSPVVVLMLLRPIFSVSDLPA
jgi:hypothetical protein